MRARIGTRSAPRAGASRQLNHCAQTLRVHPNTSVQSPPPAPRGRRRPLSLSSPPPTSSQRCRPAAHRRSRRPRAPPSPARRSGGTSSRRAATTGSSPPRGTARRRSPSPLTWACRCAAATTAGSSSRGGVAVGMPAPPRCGAEASLGDRPGAARVAARRSSLRMDAPRVGGAGGWHGCAGSAGPGSSDVPSGHRGAPTVRDGQMGC